MLEYIEVDTMICLTCDKVKIWIENGTVHYKVNAFMSKDVEIEDEICDTSAEKLSAKIESLHIPHWKNHYEPKFYRVLDGEQWTVIYKREGKEAIEKTGDNAWPRKWKKLLELMESVTGEIGDMY